VRCLPDDIVVAIDEKRREMRSDEVEAACVEADSARAAPVTQLSEGELVRNFWILMVALACCVLGVIITPGWYKCIWIFIGLALFSPVSSTWGALALCPLQQPKE